MPQFFEITARGEVPIRYLEAAIAILHGRYHDGENPIGVSFPDYICDKKHQSIGHRIRMVGPMHDLVELINHPDIKRMTSNQVISVSGIDDVPAHAVPVLFKRDRKLDQLSNRRRKGEDIDPAKADQARQQLPRLRRMSKTNGRPFHVFVRKVPAEQHHSGHYSTFGLSREGSTVPYWE